MRKMNIIQKNNKGPTCEHSGRDEEPVCTFLREWDSSAGGACKSVTVQEIVFSI